VSEDYATLISHAGACDAGRSWWPSRERWTAFLRYAVLVQVLWIAVYGGCSWLTAKHSVRWSLAMPIDAQIPLVPWTAGVYLSLGPMLWLSPFILRSPFELRALASGLAWLIILSAIGFLLLPADEPFRSSALQEVDNSLFQLSDRVNLQHNLFPSLHVGWAVFCAGAYASHTRPAAGAFFYLWAAAIATSTLLTRQHYLADVIAGALLGAAALRFSSRRAGYRSGGIRA
jgi:membrane-associated phospholipid phosphatase